MVKKAKKIEKEEEVITQVDAGAAEQSKEALLARIKELEESAAQKAQESPQGTQYYQELMKIKQKGKSGLNSIKYKEVDDHKNIPLYMTNGLRIGKMVGPLHPANAENAFSEFLRHGILLSLTPPTPEQIAKYQETPEYKKLRAEYSDLRKLRQRSKSPAAIEKLTEQISRMLGGKEVLNEIKKPGEVVSVAALARR